MHEEKLDCRRLWFLIVGANDFGTTAMAVTGDPKLVGTRMGHRDTKTTMRYNHPPKEQVERIA